jgi:hypothetical protein
MAFNATGLRRRRRWLGVEALCADSTAGSSALIGRLFAID